MNYQELKSLNESIKKIKSQVDALKYYLHTSKATDQNTKYMKIVVADMDELMNFEMSKHQRKISETLYQELHKPKKEESNERRQIQEPKKESGLGKTESVQR